MTGVAAPATVNVMATAAHPHPARHLTGQLLRFGLVGASNTAITLIAFGLLVDVGVPAAAAGAVSFALGAANGYRLNRGWTFASRERGARTAARYVAVQGFGAGLDAVSIAAVSHAWQLTRLENEALVLPVVTLLTFALAREWVFRSSAVTDKAPR
jgi:putative flippase GtrA